jgi:hypothetical protein
MMFPSAGPPQFAAEVMRVSFPTQGPANRIKNQFPCKWSISKLDKVIEYYVHNATINDQYFSNF